jgi:hypothetical protein
VCLGAQRITYLLRVHYTPSSATLAIHVASLLRTALGTLLQADLTDAAWIQACLPISLGGLGLQNPTLIRESAYLSSSLLEVHLAEHFSLPAATVSPPFWDAAKALYQFLGGIFLDDNPLRSWLQTSQSPTEQDITPKLTRQETWSTLVYKRTRDILLAGSPVRDIVRLERQAKPHSGAWLTAVPNKALGSVFGASDFRLLARFHLGLPIISSNFVGSPCPHCRDPLDLFGDHIIG